MRLFRAAGLTALGFAALMLGPWPGCSKKLEEAGKPSSGPGETTPGPAAMGPHAGKHGGMGHGHGPRDAMGHGAQGEHLPHWGYSGAEGPSHWGELAQAFAACKAGKAQSPVDIRDVAKGKAAPLEFAYAPGGLAMVDNGHTIMWKVQPGSKLTAAGTTFALKQIHFHAPSEHTVAGKAFVAEAHLVHMASDGKLAVVGVLFEVGAENPVLAKLWSHLPIKKGRWLRVKDAALDPTGLLPKDRHAWRYVGSLTTPPCTEGISWFELRTPQTLSAEQLKAFRSIYSGNARPVQPLNGRIIATGG